MKNAIINIKTDKKTKERAQKVARELGLSLSSIINAYMKTLIRTKEVYFSANPKEEPSDFMLNALMESVEDAKTGRVSPAFDDSKTAEKWLKQEAEKYAN